MNKRQKNFELCVRGIIRRGGKILVCRNKAKNYYFFPGGHINFAEGAKKALGRELKEELDIIIKEVSFIGTVENIFTEDEKTHHELNLVFNVRVKKLKDKSKEGHINFLFVDSKWLSKGNVLPIALRDSLIKWLSDKKIFWASQT